MHSLASAFSLDTVFIGLACLKELLPHISSYHLPRFSFNFRHWLTLFHQTIAISQSLGLYAILVTPTIYQEDSC
jgi:hypothetical protein